MLFQSSDEGEPDDVRCHSATAPFIRKAALVGLEPTIPYGNVVQQAVGTCIQKTDEVGESETCGALSTELRRDVHPSCAGGTRTHDPRVMTHVLQFGSRSYFQGDEVVARGSVRESNPQDHSRGPPVALDGRCTPTGSRQSAFNCPTKVCPEFLVYGRPCRQACCRSLTGPFVSERHRRRSLAGRPASLP